VITRDVSVMTVQAGGAAGAVLRQASVRCTLIAPHANLGVVPVPVLSAHWQAMAAAAVSSGPC